MERKLDDKDNSTNKEKMALTKSILSKNSINARYSHFLSVPLIMTPHLQSRLNDFYQRVAEVDKHALNFQYDKPLHFTLAVLALQEAQVQTLVKALEQNEKLIAESFNHPKLQNISKPYAFTMNSIGVFGPPKNAVAVFGEVIETEFADRLNALAHCVIKIMLEHGVIKNFKDIPHIVFDKKSNQFRVERFHVTIMKRNNKYGGFNSQNVMSHLKDFEFGKVEFDRVALRKMDAVHTEIAASQL